MTPEQQQIAIAEARGWKKLATPGAWISPKGRFHYPPEATIPDYLNDFNSCVDLIDFMDLRGYPCVLVAQVGRRRCSFINAGSDVDFTVIADKFETAICEAFLKAMNLWKE